MSLLDDVSIVVTPNGYKAGTLYGVLPTATEGSDLVTNGGFDTDSDWSGSGSNGWTISGGKASNDGTVGSNNLSQSGILLVDKRYKIEITVSNYVSGNVQVSAGATPRGTMTANGTYTFYQTCTPSTTFYIIANSFDGSVDNVSVKEWTASDMDVTRATAATRVDENGLVNYAEVLGDELVTDGDFPTGTNAWSTGGEWVISGGVASTVGTTKGAIAQNCLIYGLNKLTFTLISGEVSVYTQYPSFGVRNSYTVADTYTIYLHNENNPTLYFYNKDAGTPASISNVSVKEADRDNVPRIDYTGGGCPHILAEPQRTNILPYSEDFNIWSTTFSTIESNSTTAPDGTLTATKLKEDTTDNRHGMFYQGYSAGSSSNYSFSLFVKNNDRRYVVVILNEVGATTYYGIVVDLETGILTQELVSSVSAYSYKIEKKENDWYRLSISANLQLRYVTIATSDSSTFTPIIYGYNSYLGTNKSIYIWGAQLEAASYPTSYIPTSGSSVTRNQDQFTRDGIGSLINSTEGVLFAEISALADDGTYRLISISDGTNNNRVTLGFSNNNNKFYFQLKASSNNIFAEQITETHLNSNKIAFKYKSGELCVYINGVKVIDRTDTFTFNSNLNDLSLFEQTTINPFFGKVKQLQVYDTALTDNQLIQLTGEAGTHFFESYSEMAETLTYTIQ